MYQIGLITKAELIAKAEKLDAELRKIDNNGSKEPVDNEALITAIDSISEEWSKVPTDEKRFLMNHLDASITLCTNHEQPLWLELSTPLLSEPVRTEGRVRGNRWGIEVY
jgi:hypothetical protein